MQINKNLKYLLKKFFDKNLKINGLFFIMNFKNQSYVQLNFVKINFFKLIFFKNGLLFLLNFIQNL